MTKQSQSGHGNKLTYLIFGDASVILCYNWQGPIRGTMPVMPTQMGNMLLTRECLILSTATLLAVVDIKSVHGAPCD